VRLVGVGALIGYPIKVAAASPQSARATSPLSAAAGRRLLAEVKRQQREIRRLREEVLGGR
jgi:hypothetical protein